MLYTNEDIHYLILVRDTWDGNYVLKEIHEGISISHSREKVITSYFAQWELDLIWSMPIGHGYAKYAIIPINYVTKWVKAEPLATLTYKHN